MGLFVTDNDCKTCKVLTEALEFERSRNRELTETLTSLIKPTPIIQEIRQANLAARPIGITFSRRRAELEKQDRLRVQAENSPLAAKPDTELSKNQKTIEQLESELGVKEIDSESENEANGTR